MKVCGICWSEVVPDGCAFYCKNDNHLISKEEINWINPGCIFDTVTASYGVKPTYFGGIKQ